MIILQRLRWLGEISDSSLRLDRQKAGLYAAAGVGEYWIINLGKRSLELHRQPIADSSAESGHRYSEVRELGESDMIAPLSKSDALIQVKRFFE